MDTEDNKKDIFSELKSDLKKRGIPQKTFTDRFYQKHVNQEASEDDLDKNYERFKKRCKNKVDLAALYYIAFQSLYGESLKSSSINAAWEFFVEISDRITAKPLPDDQGSEIAALSSIHSVFATRREICKKYGPDSNGFKSFTSQYMDIIRSFTSKWHGLLDNADSNKKSEFRVELKELQKVSISFIDSLKNKYSFE